MRFVCDKESLLNAISIAQKAVTGKSTMPILHGLLIKVKNKTITIIGTDIDLSIETKFQAIVSEEGSLVVDSRLFGDVIRKLPNDDIEVNSIDSKTIEIKCQKSKFNLVHMNSDDFPELPKVNEHNMLKISQKRLKNMIKGTIFAVAQDETRPILTGVLFEIKERTMNLVALDGYRLALRKEFIDSDENINAVIPGKTLNEVVKILEEDGDLNVTFTLNHILFNLGDTKIISRLLEGEFIKYSSIIPSEHNLKIIANRSEILNCIERASLVAKEGNTNLIKFNIDDENIVITSNSQLGNVREELNIIMQGQSLQIAFNSKYLIDALRIMEEEKISIEFTSAVSPCIVKNVENLNCIYLILPVRISNN